MNWSDYLSPSYALFLVYANRFFYIRLRPNSKHDPNRKICWGRSVSEWEKWGTQLGLVGVILICRAGSDEFGWPNWIKPEFSCLWHFGNTINLSTYFDQSHHNKHINYVAKISPAWEFWIYPVRPSEFWTHSNSSKSPPTNPNYSDVRDLSGSDLMGLELGRGQSWKIASVENSDINWIQGLD